MPANTIPTFTREQLLWLRRRYAQPATKPCSDMAHANWLAGRASVVTELITFMADPNRPPQRRP